jgi:ribosome-associated toxin RatA of RatAB toxin-antitoxin module
MPNVESVVHVGAPPDRVYAVAKDVERFPEFLPDVESVTVLERDGSRVVSAWVGLVREFNRTIKWTEADDWDDAARRCEFRATEGDWDRYQGEWTFDAEDGGTRVRLALDFEMNVPLIGPLIRRVLAKLVRNNCDRMLEALKARVESTEG